MRATAERPDRALKRIIRKGGHVVLLDGTPVRTRRRTGSDNRRSHSGRHKSHGLLFLGITDTRGPLIRICAGHPGRSSETTTARHNGITRRLREAGLGSALCGCAGKRSAHGLVFLVLHGRVAPSVPE
jgi:hypothetical protein